MRENSVSKDDLVSTPLSGSSLVSNAALIST